MGNTAAISSKSCCAENCAHSLSLPKSTSSQTDYVTSERKSSRNEFVDEDNIRKFSTHRRDNQATDRLCATKNGNSSNSKTVTTTRKMNDWKQNSMLDRLGQPTFDGYSSTTTESFNKISGIDFVKNGRLNKGMTFLIGERQKLGILGLIPPAVKTDDEELARYEANIDRLEDDLDKYVYLSNLQATNERLFYKLLDSNVAKYMPLVYTPTVGLACQKFSFIYQNPLRGLFVTIHDKGYVYEVLRNWPETDIRAIVVTDGERILGLGDLGANGMGIPIGKLSLYSALAGIKPSQCLPITLDVGCNTESILNDSFYVGLRHKRTSGQEYDDFLDEFMTACVRRFGRNVLIQFEDFANKNAFRLLDKYRDSYCVFNDDIQGTASVALAGLLAALKCTKKKLSDNKIMFQGAGEAALGIANLCVMAMHTIDGVSIREARDRIYLIDSKGLVVKNRPEGGITGHKEDFVKNMPPVRNLKDAVAKVQPSVLIGASAIKGAFDEEILRTMASFNDYPLIFALSNPTSRAECTAEEAYKYTDGKALFASGSPFDPVTIHGRRFEPGQGNNSYVFPGIALGVICGGIRIMHDEIFIIAAQTLSAIVNDNDLEVGRLYPPLQNIKSCSLQIAKAVMIEGYKKNVCSTYPQPENIDAFIKSQMYNVQQTSILPSEYDYRYESK